MHRKNRLGIGILLVLSISGCAFLYAGYKGLQQAQHDFALFQAISSNDTQAAIRALNAGADANARYNGEKPPTLQDQIRLLLARLVPHKAGKSSETDVPALMYLFERGMDTPEHPHSNPQHIENADIAKALLEHGADPNVRGCSGIRTSALLTPGEPPPWTPVSSANGRTLPAQTMCSGCRTVATGCSFTGAARNPATTVSRSTR